MQSRAAGIADHILPLGNLPPPTHIPLLHNRITAPAADAHFNECLFVRFLVDKNHVSSLDNVPGLVINIQLGSGAAFPSRHSVFFIVSEGKLNLVSNENNNSNSNSDNNNPVWSKYLTIGHSADLQPFVSNTLGLQ